MSPRVTRHWILWVISLFVPAAASAQAAVDSAATIAPDSVARALLADVLLMKSPPARYTRYATINNFTGAVLPGYEGNRAYLRREAAVALARVQHRLLTGGMGLKVFDGYRPVRATLGMVAWAERTGQRHLIEDGYIASHSRHNLGLAVDLTLVDWSMGGREVDMGTPYDTFSESAHYANAAGRTLRYRQLLRRVMEEEGFRQYDQEWWHYSYQMAGEAMAFDMVVR